jgi:hypothetical protein
MIKLYLNVKKHKNYYVKNFIIILFIINKIMRRSTYTPIIEVGCTSVQADHPLTYCLGTNIDQRFLHGSSAMGIDGQASRNCQLYLSEYCANQWDQFCEFASLNNNVSYPNTMDGLSLGDVACRGLTQGQVLIHNTARRKYLKTMGNCKLKFEPFDPNVANSPLISYWAKGSGPCGGTSCAGGCGISGSCCPTYAVDPKTIDCDPVMNKILDNPKIALDILLNIFNTMKRDGTLMQLQGTRLWNFYMSLPFFVDRLKR